MAVPKCVTGKRVYLTEVLAEDALVDAWRVNNYRDGHGPVNVYRCDDCGYYHFTSKGVMHERLSKAIASGDIDRHRRAGDWEERLKKRR